MKKKKFIQLKNVQEFMQKQAEEIRLEYFLILNMLEENGRLSMPYGEKLSSKDLFAIRIIRSGNVRIFYTYGVNNVIYGLHAYVKKTQKIPKKELKQAEKILKLLRSKGFVK
jgi:phage-related protein